jgi:hypothetical protein
MIVGYKKVPWDSDHHTVQRRVAVWCRSLYGSVENHSRVQRGPLQGSAHCMVQQGVKLTVGSAQGHSRVQCSASQVTIEPNGGSL